MTSENGPNGRPTKPEGCSSLDPIEEYLVLCPTLEDAGALARCTDEAVINADSWDRPGIEGKLRGRKIILIFPNPETPDQIEVMKRLWRSKAQEVRVWRPTYFGDPLYQTLGDLDERWNLGLMLSLEQPWLEPFLDKTPVGSEKKKS